MSLLSQIIGHRLQIENLLKMQEKKQIPHALLFSGPKGIGKKTLARAFSAELLGGNSDKLVEIGNHPDFHLLKKEPEKKEVLVDQVRELSSRLKLKPYQSDLTLALIDDAHELNLTAANALLMTLEEPPSHSHLILVSDTPHKLPETIISRCQIVSFAPLSTQELEELIKKLFQIEDEKLLNLLTTICDGSLEALQLDHLFDPLTFKIIEQEDAKKHLVNIGKKIKLLEDKILNLVNSPAEEASKKAVELASELTSEKAELKNSLQLIQHCLRKVLRSNPKQGVSELLLEALQVEENVSKFNLNPQLQLCSLLLTIANANTG